MYYYFIPTNYYAPFRAVNKTIQQLENAGGMRLFKNTGIADSITAYYEHVKNAENQFATYLKYFDIYHEEAFHLFSYTQIDASFTNPEQLLTMKQKLKLKTTNPDVIDNVFGKLYIIRAITGINITLFKEVLIQAKKTISFLKSTYHIE